MGSGASAASALLSVNNLEVVYDDVMLVLRGRQPDGARRRDRRPARRERRGQDHAAAGGRPDCSTSHDGEITKGSVAFDGQPIHRPCRRPDRAPRRHAGAWRAGGSSPS